MTYTKAIPEQWKGSYFTACPVAQNDQGRYEPDLPPGVKWNATYAQVGGTWIAIVQTPVPVAPERVPAGYAEIKEAALARGYAATLQKELIRFS